MRTLTGPQQAELDAGRVCKIVKAVLTDATVLGYTNHDKQLIIGGVTYSPAAVTPGGKIVSRVGASVDNQTFKAAWGEQLEQDFIDGRYDDAVVTAGLAFWALDPPEAITIFQGDLGKLGWNRDGFQAVIMDQMRSLGQPVGKTFGPGCPLVLGEPRCGVALDTYQISGTVTAVDPTNPRLIFTDSARGEAAAWFTDGDVKWISGANAGAKLHTVDGFDGAGEFVLQLPLINAVQVGDQYEARPGCNKTSDNCRNKFTNGTNFGGDPFLRGETQIQ